MTGIPVYLKKYIYQNAELYGIQHRTLYLETVLHQVQQQVAGDISKITPELLLAAARNPDNVPTHCYKLLAAKEASRDI